MTNVKYYEVFPDHIDVQVDTYYTSAKEKST